MINHFVLEQLLKMADELEVTVSDVDTIPCTEAKRGEPTCLNKKPHQSASPADLCYGCRCAYHCRQLVGALYYLAKVNGLSVDWRDVDHSGSV